MLQFHLHLYRGRSIKIFKITYKLSVIKYVFLLFNLIHKVSKTIFYSIQIQLKCGKSIEKIKHSWLRTENEVSPEIKKIL